MRSRLLFVTICVTVLHLLSLHSNPASAASIKAASLPLESYATVTGQVMAHSGWPAIGVEVVAYPATNSGSNAVGAIDVQALARTTVDATGQYTLMLEYSGAVRVAFYDPQTRFQSEYFDNVRSGLSLENFAAATELPVLQGVVTEGIDAELDQFGQIQGRITTIDGAPIVGVTVNLYQQAEDDSYNPIQAPVFSRNDGSYEIVVLKDGIYRVCFNLSSNDTLYAPSCFGGDSPTTATDLAIVTNQSIESVDVALNAFGRIHGQILNRIGEPIQGAIVKLVPSLSPQSVYETRSNESGLYEVRALPPGTYYAYVNANDSGYAAEWYENASTFSSATALTVEFNRASQINFELVAQAQIVGDVRDQEGVPVAGVIVTAYTSAPGNSGALHWQATISTTTLADGSYSFGWVTPSTYRVGFDGGADFLPVFYDGASSVEDAKDLVLGEGASAVSVNGQLIAKPRFLTGQVRTMQGEPLAEIRVRLYRPTPGNSQMWVPTPYKTTTNAAGLYTFTNVATGQYQVEFSDPKKYYVDEVYNNAAEVGKGNTLEIVAGTSVSGIDAELGGYAEITGRVSNALGEGLKGEEVRLYGWIGGQNEHKWRELRSTLTQPDGTYRLETLGGTYKICAGGNQRPSHYTAGCYQNSANVDDANLIDVEHNAVREGIEIVLSKRATLSATITLALDNVPNSIQNVRFNGDFGEFRLDDNNPDDGDNFGQQTTFTVESGIYTITQTPMVGRFLAGITCNEPEWVQIDLANASLVVNLPPEASLVCTFINERGVNIRSRIYHDRNGDGVRNGENETGLAAWTVTVYDYAGTQLRQSLTDEAGHANFGPLPSGAYMICATLSVNWSNSQPGVLDPTYKQPCYSVSLLPGQGTTVRFGNIESVSPHFRNTPSLSRDGIEVIDEPEEAEGVESTQRVFLPLVTNR